MLNATLDHREGRVELQELGAGRTRIRVSPGGSATFVAERACDTAYPRELIELILRVKGPGHLCDEIMRDEAPDYVQALLEFGTLAYLPADWFAGKRILDFGCGSGASTVILARMFGRSDIVGVDMEGELLDVARARAEYYGLERLRFLASPDPESLPAELGSFDAVFFNALYEHLLPRERELLTPMIWRALEPGGVLLLTETPNRRFPVERHTTGMPLLNYLPRQVVLPIARRFSDRVGASESWDSLLRRGIRGGSVGTILRALKSDGGGRPELLAPSLLGCRDRIDLWQQLSQRMAGGGAPGVRKRLLVNALKAFKGITGVELLPELSLAFRKG
jgi:ubiquinone/menaquinone biosynthesis C-methylase UbiE